MSAPRRKYIQQCGECGRDYHPFHRGQKTCSQSCGAAYRHRMTLDPVVRRGWAQKGQQALQAKRNKAIGAQLRQCKTLGDAYRLGRKQGYVAGWLRGRRSVRDPVYQRREILSAREDQLEQEA